VKCRSLIAILFLASVMQGKDVKAHESGTLLQMESVQCGYRTAERVLQERSWEPILRTIKTHAVLCQEYIVQSEKNGQRSLARSADAGHGWFCADPSHPKGSHFKGTAHFCHDGQDSNTRRDRTADSRDPGLVSQEWLWQQQLIVEVGRVVRQRKRARSAGQS
jgi:hypothetical protein